MRPPSVRLELVAAWNQLFVTLESSSILGLLRVLHQAVIGYLLRKYISKLHDIYKSFILSVLCLFVAPWTTIVVGKKVLRSAVNDSSEQAAAKRQSTKCFGFMFRTRRSCYIKRLSELANEAERTVEVVNLLKKLNNQQLENLMLSVESKGAEEAPCIVLPVGDVPRPDRGHSVQLHVRFCQVWRWADLSPSQELKKLPVCRTSQNFQVCINPFHWSYLYKPDSAFNDSRITSHLSDSPPPAYSAQPLESSKYDSTYSESRLTSHLSGSSDFSKPWCKVAYWELKDRVGRQFQTSNPTFNVFADLPHGDGMCLETLANMRLTENKSILETRTKIGQGITIFKEDQKVWVYNRSDYPLFVNSPTLDPPNSEKFTVYKLFPGYCINIFDYELSKINHRIRKSSSLTNGPIDDYTVRISFAKGWGSSKYSRRCIECCPCWLEVMFLVHR